MSKGSRSKGDLLNIVALTLEDAPTGTIYFSTKIYSQFEIVAIHYMDEAEHCQNLAFIQRDHLVAHGPTIHYPFDYCWRY